MMKKLSITALFCLSCAGAAISQMRYEVRRDGDLTGNLRWDLLPNAPVQDSIAAAQVSQERKSPLVAALLSAAVPGAGEFYTESYWRAGSFLAAEAVLWIVYATRTRKGNDQTAEFQRYADSHWSVVRYAEWIEANDAILNPDAPPCTGIVTNPDPSVAPWERVDWGVLNQCEANIGAKASTGFSHRLPRRPEQQYYELIGKYLQYNAGWDDWGSGGPTTSEYLISPSPRFSKYRDMRGRANEYYNIASTASFLLVANHILSALDAAWSASQYNAGIKVRAHIQPILREYDYVEFVPTATISLEF